MSRWVLAFAAVAVITGSAMAADKETGKGDDQEKTILVVEGTGGGNEFEVAMNQLVRITGDGIAGAKITVKIDGPAKLEASANIVKLVNGKRLFGPSAKEFVIRPTGKGKVKVAISVQNPTDNLPKTTVYHFTVE